MIACAYIALSFYITRQFVSMIYEFHNADGMFLFRPIGIVLAILGIIGIASA